MTDLKFDLMQLCSARDGSEGTRKRRKEGLGLVADQLHELGYKRLRATQIKGRHAVALVRRWQGEGIATGTIKTRLSYIRYWAKRVGRAHVLYPDNALYGIDPRPRSVESKALGLTEEQLSRLTGPYVERMRVSLRLMRYLGLRREEAMRWKPKVAIVRDENGMIVEANIAKGWGKNGRPRTLPIRNDEQRQAMEDSIRVCTADGSMIPDTLRVEQYRNMIEYRTRLVGIDSKHALRHEFAAELYRELTGCEPMNTRKPGDAIPKRTADRAARDEVSRQLGHSRRVVVDAYLGRHRGS